MKAKWIFIADQRLSTQYSIFETLSTATPEVRGVAADHLRLQQFLSATDKFETRLVKGAHEDDVDA